MYDHEYLLIGWLRKGNRYGSSTHPTPNGDSGESVPPCTAVVKLMSVKTPQSGTLTGSGLEVSGVRRSATAPSVEAKLAKTTGILKILKTVW